MRSHALSIGGLRGCGYASMHTLNASSIGVGDTPEAAFADWLRQHRAVMVQTLA